MGTDESSHNENKIDSSSVSVPIQPGLTLSILYIYN